MLEQRKNILDYPWDSDDFVANFIAQTFYYVCHSERLLCLSMARLNEKSHYHRFREHLKEESGHDKLAINDLKRLGKVIEQYPELSSTTAMYECQYYKIEHQHPLALLGYIYFLEDLASKVGIKIHEKIERSLGISSSFLKVHGEEDVSHVEKAKKLIDSLPQDLQNIIWKNHMQSQHLYFSMLDEVLKTSLVSMPAKEVA